jgi:2-dehydropantoate 2-reductase
MRFVVYGAGAIGGGIGGLLARSGAEVTLVARGAHLDALQADGIELRRPSGSDRVGVPAVGHVRDAGAGPGDVVILAVKSQHTAGALDELAALGQPDLRVVCAQNGVDNERQALRHFGQVYGLCVLMPASHLEPGVVDLRDGPVSGILDVGRYPAGADDDASAIASALRAGGFSSEVHPAIMTRKYRKLISNLSNAVDAATGPAGRHSFLVDAARAEAVACFEAAGIEVGSEEEDKARRAAMPWPITPVSNRPTGSSSWQSLARGSSSIEAGYLTGEVVLIGRLHAVPTPANEFLARLAADLVRRGAPPASMSLAELEAEARRAGIVAPA